FVIEDFPPNSFGILVRFFLVSIEYNSTVNPNFERTTHGRLCAGNCSPAKLLLRIPRSANRAPARKQYFSYRNRRHTYPWVVHPVLLFSLARGSGSSNRSRKTPLHGPYHWEKITLPALMFVTSFCVWQL